MNLKCRNKQFVEEVLIEGAVKTTIQILYDKVLIDNFDNVDEVSKDVLIFEKRKPDLDEKMMKSFNDFIHRNNLKKKTSFIKSQQILSFLSLADVGTYLRDGPFKTDKKIVNLHPFQGTHWVLYIHQCYFDSGGCSPPQILPEFIIK